MTSGKERCNHNWVDHDELLRLTLGMIRRILSTEQVRAKVEKRIREIASAEDGPSDTDFGHDDLHRRRERLLGEKKLAGRNLTRAKNDDEYDIISAELGNIKERLAHVEQEIESKARLSAQAGIELEPEVEKAMKTLDTLDWDIAELHGLELEKLLDALNVSVWLQFKKTQPKKRIINRLTSGLITTGSMPPPVEPYHAVGGVLRRESELTDTDDDDEQNRPGFGRGDFLEKVNRGDRI